MYQLLVSYDCGVRYRPDREAEMIEELEPRMRQLDEQGRSAFGLAVEVVDWLPQSVALLAGDDTVVVVSGDTFVGVLERRGHQWNWR